MLFSRKPQLCTLQMQVAGFTEMLVDIHQPTWRHKPEYGVFVDVASFRLV
jgi:hypothetical protein